MNLTRTLSIFVASVAVCLSSCKTGPELRIEKNPQLYGKLSSKDKDRVQKGVVREGMTQEAVFLAWGRPDRVMSGGRNGRSSEKWAYFDTQPVSTVSVGFGGGFAHPFYSNFGVHPRYGYALGPGWGYGSGIDFVQQISKQVEFSNGRVTAWERRR